MASNRFALARATVMSEGTERASGLLKTGGDKEQSLKKRDTQIRKRKREKKEKKNNDHTTAKPLAELAGLEVGHVTIGRSSSSKIFFFLFFKNLPLLLLKIFLKNVLPHQSFSSKILFFKNHHLLQKSFSKVFFFFFFFSVSTF